MVFEAENFAEMKRHVALGVAIGVLEVLGVRRPWAKPFGPVTADRDLADARSEQRAKHAAEPVTADATSAHREPDVGPTGHREWGLRSQHTRRTVARRPVSDGIDR